MERIKQFISVDEGYHPPYNNHYGYGHPLGSGDDAGIGNGFVAYKKEDKWNGESIKSFNGNDVIMVDGYVLYITHVHEPWAIGEIIKNDLTTQRCYVGRINNNFVLADNLKDVLEKLRLKIFKSTNIFNDIANAFLYAHPNYNEEYDWDEMVMWHSLDPTSCADGRKKFTQMADKKSGMKATPKELITWMKNSPSRHIGEILEKAYLGK